MADDGSLCAISAREIGFMPFHVYHRPRILLVLEGEVRATWVSGSQVIRSNEVEILNVNEPVQMEGKDNLSLLFEFDTDFFERYCPMVRKRTYACNCAIFFFSVAEASKREQLARMLVQIYYAKSGGHDDLADLVRDLARLVSDDFDDVKNMFTSMPNLESHQERFLRISDYMLEHLDERITLQSLADLEHLSLPYLSSVFSEKLKRNFRGMLDYYRMIEAVRLCITTRAPITEIAHRCGYSAPRYFYKTFHQFRGCSPGEFRRQLKSRPAQCEPVALADRRISSFFLRQMGAPDNPYYVRRLAPGSLRRTPVASMPRTRYLLGELGMIMEKGTQAGAGISRHPVYDTHIFAAFLLSLFIEQKDISWIVMQADAKAEGLLTGQNGLRTACGLKKPAYWAVDFIWRLCEDAESLYIGQGCVVSWKKSGEQMILLVNCPGNALFELYDRRDDYPSVRYEIELEAAPGTCVTAERVDNRRGSLCELWSQMGNTGNLTPQQRQLVAKTLHPGLRLDRVDAGLLHVNLAPFAFELITVPPNCTYTPTSTSIRACCENEEPRA